MIRASLYTIALAVAILTVHGSFAQAQFGGDDDLLKELQRRALEMQRDEGGEVPPTVPRQDQMNFRGDSDGEWMEPARDKGLTAVEQDYSRRAGRELKLVGYDGLRNRRGGQGRLYGASPAGYLLGAGDEVVVTLRGQRNASYTTQVDREGRVVLPELPPITAGGRTFEDFSASVQALVDDSLLETSAHVSLGRVRQISVLVSGEVFRPGVLPLTGLSTAIEALSAAGGVMKSGSLRRVRLIRDERALEIDLYDVLLTGRNTPDLRLREGDRLVVPALGPTVAVSGEVVRPGIYEIDPGGLRADALLDLAGGTVRGRGYRFFRITPTADGPGAVEPLAMDQRPVLRQGDILMIEKTAESRVGYVSVDGHVTAPGDWSLAATPRLSDVLATPGLLDEAPYLPFVIIRTRDPITMATRYEAVDGIAVRLGMTDYQFRDRDTVIILRQSDIQYLSSADVQKILAGELPAYGLTAEEEQDLFANDPDENEMIARMELQKERKMIVSTGQAVRRDVKNTARMIRQAPNQRLQQQLGDAEQGKIGAVGDAGLYSMKICGGLRRLASLVQRRGVDAGTLHVMFPAGGPERVEDVLACPRIYDRFPEILPFALEHAAGVVGAVRLPGVYPIVPGGRVADVVRAAGGPTATAELSVLELDYARSGEGAGRQQMSYDEAMRSARVGPGDYIRVAPRFEERAGGVVVVRGEVRKPGVYTIRRGERLSELLQRAGGLTDEAYPSAAVFTREAAREAEKASYDVMARELEAGLAQSIAMSRVDSGDSGDLLPLVDRLAVSLREAEALGRVTAVVDPVVLQVRPELDTVLQPGDRLHVPARPNHVAVTGEVLHAGAFQHIAGATPDAYIRKAGGTRQTADEARIFVILPSGEAHPVKVSFWNYSDNQIPPGSTLVVPPDLTPFSFWERAKDLTQVLSQFAISAASLAVINRN